MLQSVQYYNCFCLFLIFLSAENLFLNVELNILMIHKVVHVNENHIKVLTSWPLLIICPYNITV